MPSQRPGTVVLLFADRTGPREGSDTIDFQRFNFLVASFVVVISKRPTFFTNTYNFERDRAKLTAVGGICDHKLGGSLVTGTNVYVFTT